MNQKFKIGDLVKCVDNINFGKTLEKGVVYRVTGISEPICTGDEYCISISNAPRNVFMKESRFKLYEKPEELNKTTFKVGDIVEAFGCRGVVFEIYNGTDALPVGVEFGPGSVAWFTEDGRNKDWHKTPSLVLVSRPKKMVTKTVERWLNVYPNGAENQHDTEAEANMFAKINRIACVKLTGSYETESDDE